MKKLFLVPFILSLFFLAGCDDDKQEQNEKLFKQGWLLVAEKQNGADVDISGIPIPELMYFGNQSVCYLAIPVNNQGTWTYKNTRTAWSYDDSHLTLNIASLLPVTYYVETINNSSLIVRYNAFTSTGSIDTYIKEYASAKVRVENLTIRLDE